MRVLTIIGLFLLALAQPALAAPVAVLIEERARADYAADLPDDSAFEVILAEQPQADVVTLAEFWMDVPSGKFLVNAVLSTGTVQRLSGLAVVSIPVPVPNRRILPDEIIGEDDLVSANLPMGQAQGYIVTAADDVIGKQVRRMLSPGRPIQAQSVIQPLVVTRGDRVDIVFSDGLLSLSSPGRALGDAHRGQEVRIVNLVSNKTVTAVATGDGTVEILR